MAYRSFPVALLMISACDVEISIRKPDEALGPGNPPDLETPTKSENIVQTTNPQVDILWVVDNSCSMAEEQEKLADNFPAFMQFFIDSGLDWHVGVVSTDTYADDERGKLQGAAGYRYLTPASPDPIALFPEMSILGTRGSGDEKGRRAVHLALTDPLKSGFNRGFYRDDASLNVIVISDEDDYSGSDPTRNEFINFLTTLKEDPELVTFSSIVGPVGGCPTAFPGPEYISVSEAVGGIVESICSSDWAPVLEELGLRAAGLRREYFLSEIPVPGTIRVRVNDGDYFYQGIDSSLIVVPEDRSMLCEAAFCFTFSYSEVRNSILMEDYVPSPLAKINIEYQLLSGYQGESPIWQTNGDTDE